jgi:heterodisulfide reductase subunit B
MVARNDITGDAIQSRQAAKEYAERYDKVDRSLTREQLREAVEEHRAIVAKNCPWCHIKVATSNGKCPCCNRELV